MLTIEARATGRRRPLVPHWQLPLFDDAFTGAPLTLRELIARIVREEVVAFEERRRERALLRVLSERELEAGVERGRVVPGDGGGVGQRVDAEAAVGTALQAFEDGVYFVFVDGRQHERLEEQVFLGADSTVTFVRLVPLAGG
jgi:hypothetical protein